MDMERLQLWDNHNKQWLDIMSIQFDGEGKPTRIGAIVPGDDPLSDGWYNLEGDDLDKVAIKGSINFNTELIPEE